MKTETAYGVVPNLDDLTWEWEPQDGALLQDLLLCSVLPSLHKTSVVFVEANVSIDEGYGLNNMELNESWYQQNSCEAFFTQQSVVTTPIYNEQYNFPDVSKNSNVEMDYSSAPSDIPSIDFTMEDFAQFYQQENSNLEVSNADNTEMNGRKSVGSEYSCSSDSSGETSSRTTELSQEEIFEEIQRECAEIEHRSTSPPLEFSSTRKANRRGFTNNRKKELNRVAAAKYREKKRLERESRHEQLQQLESHNRALKTQASSLENEIKYLRELIGEIRSRQ